MNSPFLAGFEKLVADRPDAPLVFALSEHRVATATDLAGEAEAMRTAFAAATLPEGSCVVAALGNHSSWFALFLACLARGDTLISLDAETTTEEADRIASRYGASALVGLASRRDVMGAPSVDLPGGLGLVALHGHEPRSWGDARWLKLTSGSSGEPKAVRVSEENLWNDGRHIVEAMDIRPDDVNYGIIPLSHSYGLGNLVAPLFFQGTPVALRDLFLPGRLFEDAKETGLSILPGVPFLFQQIFEHYRDAGLTPSLRLLLSAGARIDAELVRRFKERLGMKIHSFYGSSETGGITYDSGDDITNPLNVGTAMPETEVTLSEQGRVYVRGSAVALGYVETGDDDVAEFVAGGFATGDLGQLDEAGRLYLTGRLTSFVNVAGRKVDPGEAERVLAEMREIAAVKVLGLPCDKRGQKLVAFIVPASGNLRPLQIRSYCAERLSPHKIPRDFVFLDRMPVTARGKVDRKALERLGEEAEALD